MSSRSSTPSKKSDAKRPVASATSPRGVVSVKTREARNVSTSRALMAVAHDIRTGQISSKSIVHSFLKTFDPAAPEEKRHLALVLKDLSDELILAANENSAPAATQPMASQAGSFMATLRHETDAKVRQLAADKELLGNAEMSEAMAVKPQGLSKALKERRIFAINGPKGSMLYPAFFADHRYDRRTLYRVCEALGDLPGLSKWQFFTQPRVSLDKKSPLQAIEEGKLDKVMAAAKAFVER